MIFFKKLNNSKKDKVFIDSGFIDSQFLWVLPIVDGYCQKIGISKIVLQRKLPFKLKQNIKIKEFLSNYKIEYLEKNNSFFLKLSVLIFSAITFPYCLSKMNRKNLLGEKNWFKSQVYHAIWDTSLSLGKDGDLKPKLKNMFKSFFLINRNFYLAYLLKKKHLIHSCFLSHSVYQGRIFLAELRKTSEVFCQSAFNIYKQPKNYDECWSILRNTHNLKSILKSISDKDCETYWQNRLTGKGTIYESNVINKFDNQNLDKDINILMLHVFRDSSYNFIDNKRIFSDYIDWVYTTLKILKNTKEKWFIRPHPFSSKWGENSFKFIDAINKSLKINNKKIFYLNKNISNNLIFQKAKKLVTYAGTSFLEYACYGKKSIIISDVVPGIYQEQIALKPRNIKEYEQLLIENVDKKKFNLDSESLKLSKKILYARENITNLAKDTGGYFVYRNDKENTKDHEYECVQLKVENNNKYFNELGSKLAINNFSHSISSKYINKI